MNTAKITKRTVCSRDCPDACSILVEVEDGRAVSLRGDPEDPVTAGFLCERTSKFLGRQYSEDRFTSPMLRVDGELKAISWSEALDLAAQKLKTVKEESGGQAILDFRGGGSLGMLTRLTSVLLDQFGPVTQKSGDICSGAGEAAQVADMGMCESHDIFDTLNSSLIVIWGKDVHTSGVHLLPILKRAQKNGCKLVGIDVRGTKLKALCDDFSLVRPGGDAALAFGLARHLFDQGGIVENAPDFCDNFESYKQLVHRKTVSEWAEEAGVSRSFLEGLGDDMQGSKPVSFQIGWGLARRKSGAMTVRAIDALAAVSGNLGIPGGGANFCVARSAPFNKDYGLPKHKAPRKLKESLLGQEILACGAGEHPIRLIWVTAGNPVSMLPDSLKVKEAFDSTEFVVVVDTHPTDTTDVADLVLPTLTLLEDDDVMGAFGNHYLRASTPALTPPDGPKHEFHIVQGLAERLGLGQMFAGSVALWKEKVTQSICAEGPTLEELHQNPCLRPHANPVLFLGQRFPTPSGKFQLIDDFPEPTQIDPEYPLTLLATSSPKSQSSQWAVDPIGIVDRLRVHPQGAKGFAHGERVLLESRQGAMAVTLVLDPHLQPQVAYLPKGGMLRHGACPNGLIKAVETDFGGGASYYDEPVRIRGLQG